MDGEIVKVIMILIVEIILFFVLKIFDFLNPGIDFKSESKEYQKGININENYTQYCIDSAYNKYINEYKIHNDGNNRKVSFIYKDCISIVYYVLMYNKAGKNIGVYKVKDYNPKTESKKINLCKDCEKIDIVPVEVNYEKINEITYKKPNTLNMIFFTAIVSIMLGISLVALKILWDLIIFKVYGFSAKHIFDVYDYLIIFSLSCGYFVLVYFYLMLKIKKEIKIL